ncbi:hypothetical protein NDU88_006016 [Pleurodeles waltl]|uniref:Uncharacterized protein n=1 Tax=Pleurodeles waltl TaxID=8319 RepID=A0AAV7MB05_PLEWA|nr:hypothetical protein NDU88_006016 [Pleurodeles waltl]
MASSTGCSRWPAPASRLFLQLLPIEKNKEVLVPAPRCPPLQAAPAVGLLPQGSAEGPQEEPWAEPLARESAATAAKACCALRWAKPLTWGMLLPRGIRRSGGVRRSGRFSAGRKLLSSSGKSAAHHCRWAPARLS